LHDLTDRRPQVLSAIVTTMKAKPTTNEAGTANKRLARSNGLVIRNARLEELDEVSLLGKEAYIEYRHSIPREHWRFYLENIMDVRSRLAESELLVAELNNQLVGTVTLYLDSSSSLREQWPQGWAGVRILAVRPTYRHRGVGRALMEECIARCRNRNVRTIGLHTGVGMTIARKMYEDMGFVRVAEYDFQPGPGTVVTAYRLEL
jgi:GNAT superfamily N-acetyltransferase